MFCIIYIKFTNRYNNKFDQWVLTTYKLIFELSIYDWFIRQVFGFFPVSEAQFGNKLLPWECFMQGHKLQPKPGRVGV